MLKFRGHCADKIDRHGGLAYDNSMLQVPSSASRWRMDSVADSSNSTRQPYVLSRLFSRCQSGHCSQSATGTFDKRRAPQHNVGKRHPTPHRHFAVAVWSTRRLSVISSPSDTMAACGRSINYGFRRRRTRVVIARPRSQIFLRSHVTIPRAQRARTRLTGAIGCLISTNPFANSSHRNALP